MKEQTPKEPLIVYSLNPSMALDLLVAVLAFGYGVFVLVWSSVPPFPWIMGVLLVGDFYFRLWKRPVRKARFFDDHFEIDGWNVSLNAEYGRITDLSESKQPFGDFASNSRVSFSVADYPITFTIPSRRNRRLKLGLYSLLKQKAPEIGHGREEIE